MLAAGLLVAASLTPAAAAAAEEEPEDEKPTLNVTVEEESVLVGDTVRANVTLSEVPAEGTRGFIASLSVEQSNVAEFTGDVQRARIGKK